jgi:putative transposase
VRKHQRHLAGFDEAVISLNAKWMTTGDIAAHLSQVYDTWESRDLVWRVTDAVLVEMKDCSGRPLDPVYVAIGISVDGEREVLGMRIGPCGGERSKQWMNMPADLRNRGILHVCIVCCDGLKGPPDATVATWPRAALQTCVVHLVRNSLRFASKKYGAQITRELKTIYSVPAAEAAFEVFAETWGPTDPAMIAMWRRSW